MRGHTSRKKIWSACLGNFFEHYDTALYSFLSPFLAPLIFPKQEPITALILTYAIIPLSMVARPIGSLVFGYIGDVYGRGLALFWSLVGMAFISGGFALIPTYAQLGILAPILFCLGRALQNFLSGGEVMGGAIFLLENAERKHHDLLSSLYSASTMGGHLLASLGVFLMGRYYEVTLGWRFLYLFGCVTALFGCMLRRSGSVPTVKVQKFSQSIASLKNTLWMYRKPLLIIATTTGFARATYSIALILMNGLVPLVTTLTKTEVMKINTYLLILDFFALPFFGWMASKVRRETVMICSSLGVVLCAIPLLSFLKDASIGEVVLVRLVFVIFGVSFFAPFHAWAQQLVPSHCRYALISFGYAIGSQALGSPTAALALWCFKKTGLLSSVAWYWMGLGLLSGLSIMTTLRSSRKSQIEEPIA